MKKISFLIFIFSFSFAINSLAANIPDEMVVCPPENFYQDNARFLTTLILMKKSVMRQKS